MACAALNQSELSPSDKWGFSLSGKNAAKKRSSSRIRTSRLSNLGGLSKKDLENLVKRLEELEKTNAVVADLHDGQRRFIYARDSTGQLAPFVCLLSARRFGKTEGALRYGASLCLGKPRTRVVGIYQQRTDAKEVAWPILQELAVRYGWDVKLNGIELACRFKHNDSVIKLAGADDERRHRQFRGQRNDLVFIDEGQDWYSDVQKLVQGLAPGVADRNGRIFMLGTPGLLPEGYFYEVCAGEHPEWVVVNGSPFENPHTRTQLQRQLDHLRVKNPYAESLPWVRREYFGEWTTDTRKNVIKVDPSQNYLYSWAPEHDDRYIISIDWGDEAAAFVVATYNIRRYPWLVYLESHNLKQMLVQDQVSFIRGLMERYKDSVVIADPGGIAKAFVRELRQVHGIPIIAAEKEDRMAQIEFMNSDISLGLVKLFNRENPDAPEEMLLARQWRQLVWIEHRGRGVREESRPRDIHDAALYARRYAHPYLHKPEDTGPAVGSPQWHVIQAREIRDRKERRLKKRHRKY